MCTVGRQVKAGYPMTFSRSVTAAKNCSMTVNELLVQ